MTIEDAAELQLRQRHVVRLESRPASLEGRGEVTIRQLVRNALRMRPDRIVVGEVRGGEALDLLQALNTGHDGSLSTVHANSPEDALRRLETLALMADVALPHAAVREQVASAVDLVVHQARQADGSRAVTSIAEVVRVAGGVGHARAAARGADGAAARRAAGGAGRTGERRERGGAGVRGRDPRRARTPPGCRSPRAPESASPAPPGRWPIWPRRSCGWDGRGATPARSSAGGCCWPAPRSRLSRGRWSRARSPGLALGAGGPWAASRVLRARREHYRRAVEADAAAVAVALADALGAGRSLRGALAGAADGLSGAAGHELRRVAGELDAGARTEDALEAMRRPGALRAARHRRCRLPGAAPRGRRPVRAAARDAPRPSATRRAWRTRCAAPPPRLASPG